jgi:hypothetical protein
VDNKAYIFGGNVEESGRNTQVATNDMHIVTLSSSGEPESDYHLIPALPSKEGGDVPGPRSKHAACAINGCVAVYGGLDGSNVLDEAGSIWLFDPKDSSWKELRAKNAQDAGPDSRFGAKIFAHDNSLIVYGGNQTPHTESSEVWQFDIETQTWTRLPEAPVSTSSAAFTNGCVYLISSSDTISSKLHYLDLNPLKALKDIDWQTIDFPTNPMAPGPRPREDGGLLPITTGYGRNFLVYFLGAREKPSEHDESEGVTQWSDMWTLQLPSSDLSAKPKLSISEAIKPAKIKDAIRSILPGTESGVYTWAEVEVQVPNPDQLNAEGKLHPGPRSSFGCDVMADGRSVVLWGGQDAKGERVGDGWIVRLE